jgi:hypothetical protein
MPPFFSVRFSQRPREAKRPIASDMKRLSNGARLARLVIEQARGRGEVLDTADLAGEVECSMRAARRYRAELRDAGFDAPDGRTTRV